MKILSKPAAFVAACGALAVIASQGYTRADETSPVLKDHRIAYVTTALHWANYQTDDLKKDCPQGLNVNGPREIFKVLYPNGGTVEGTELTREALKVFPQDHKAQFPYILRKGPVAIGMNLDGKVNADDFVSPTGEKGIKNNLFKVLGCNANYRQPTGQMQLFANKEAQENYYTRMMVEISNVDSLENSDNVEVTLYRGREPLLVDGTGENYVPGGTQRIDTRYGKPFIQHLHGKIAGGILTTEPIKQGLWPWSIYGGTPTDLKFHDMRLQLKLTSTNADGLVAGYTDVSSFYHWITQWSTHHLSYGQMDPSEFYWVLHDNADAYPDPNGQNTAISSAMVINMAQVFIVHPDENVAANHKVQTASAR